MSKPEKKVQVSGRERFFLSRGLRRCERRSETAAEAKTVVRMAPSCGTSSAVGIANVGKIRKKNKLKETDVPVGTTCATC